MGRVGILYICTGRYTIFWDGFYRSCERHFLPGHEKHYFVFTDGEIGHTEEPRVHRIEQEDRGWPDNTLKRFHMFERIAPELEPTEYLFFFNANMLLVSDIGDEIFPSEDEGLVVTRHPGFYDRAVKDLPYERDPRSRARIPEGEGRVYVQGAFNGGRRDDFLGMIRFLRQAVDDDASRGIVAQWHDESHLNRYILGRPYKLLDPGYCYPEGATLPFAPRIMMLNKYHYGGHDYLRGQSDAPSRGEPARPSFVARVLKKIGDRISRDGGGRKKGA